MQSSVPSAERPLPFQMRRDLKLLSSLFQGQRSCVIKDGVTLQYYRLQPIQYQVLSLLDGRRSLRDIRAKLVQEFPEVRPSLGEVQQFVADLHQRGLVLSTRTGQGAALTRRRQKRHRQRLLGAVANVLYIRLPGWDPDRLLSRLYPLMKWAAHPLILAIAVSVVLASWLFLGVKFDDFQRRLPEFYQFFGWPNLLLLWATMGMAKMAHELAHGLACKHFGAECHEIGVAFLVFSPALYCDVSDSYMLAERWKRICIASAGIALELVLSAVALLIWWQTSPGLLHYLCLNVFFVTSLSTVIYNANPLLRYDGYYILCDLLGISNLRSKADRLMQRMLARLCLGIRLPRDPFMPDRHKGWFVLYSLASAAYRWFLTFAITLFLYQALKPYGLQGLGLGLGLLAIVTLLVRAGMQSYRLITNGKARQMSLWRMAVTGCVTAGIITAALFMPLPLWTDAPLLVEPRDVQRVYVTVPGRLQKIEVQPGQRVTRGQVLARLSDFGRVDRYRQLQSAKRSQEIEVALQRYLGKPAQEQLALQSLEAITAEMDDYSKQLTDLTIAAPCDGVVLPAPGRPARATLDNELGGWDGAPLRTKNLGCWMESGTHVVSIAPSSQWQAVLLVAQQDSKEIRTGQEVKLKVDHRPDSVYHATVTEVSERDRAFAPQPLSNKFGGDLPTLTDSSGRERLQSTAYEAKLLFDAPADALMAGSRGRARVMIDDRTARDWVWGYLRRTFHFLF